MPTTRIEREPVILDTTVRDGAYAVNFQFARDDLRTIIWDLDEAGIPYIEIGHGVTIGATAARGRRDETDEEYFHTARFAVRRAKLGVTIVPALAPIEKVDLAADYLDFLRMCVIATELETVAPLVERAHSKGLEVSIQLVDSHLFEPSVLARAAKQAGEMGVRIVYVVDTTGTFLPQDVRRSVGAIRGASDVTIGFRGHNHLGMAVANTLEAFEAGAEFLDGTLMNFGRGAGTCKTASLIAALQRHGHLATVDLDWILGVARASGHDPRQLEHVRNSPTKSRLSATRVIREVMKNVDGPYSSPEMFDRVVAGVQP